MSNQTVPEHAVPGPPLLVQAPPTAGAEILSQKAVNSAKISAEDLPMLNKPLPSTQRGRKKCRKCQEEKLLGEFSQCKSNSDGRKYLCKLCDAKAQRDFRAQKKNKEKKSDIESVTAEAAVPEECLAGHAIGKTFVSKNGIAAMKELSDIIKEKIQNATTAAENKNPLQEDNTTVPHPGRPWLLPEYVSESFLVIDFRLYPILYAFLKETARIEFRPVENQLLYWLNDIYEQTRTNNL